MTKEDFINKVKEEAFVEWEEVYHNNFWNPKNRGRTYLEPKKHVIFDIDVVGGLRIKKKFPQRTLAVFIKPPDINELIRRLKKRATESEEKVKMRVAKASVEMALAPQFDTIILNDDLQKALKETEQVVENFIKK